MRFLVASIILTFNLSIGLAQGLLKNQNHFIDGVERYRLIVKFTEEIPPLSLTSKISNSPLDTLRFISLTDFNQQNALSRHKSTSSKIDLGNITYVQGSENWEKESVMDLATFFEKLDNVEYAELEPIINIPPPGIIEPTVPDFISEQDYLPGYVSNDVYGVDVEYAWSMGVTGEGIKVADIEWGMDYEHEDLKSPYFQEIISTTNHSYDDHGTAVIGVIAAKDNGYGMKGGMYNVDTVFGFSEIRHGRSYAISNSLNYLDEGDVLILEMQAIGLNGEYVPADISQTVWDLINTATSRGIIVVAAAGNGNDNLDDVIYDSYRARGDHKGIVVGAGTRNGRNKASFSTYGSPVHVQGWGDWSVATTGYGGLYDGGEHSTYTRSFSGTSSATPIVALAIIAIQSYSKQKYNTILMPLEIRNILISTGRAQGTGGHIGPLPDIQAAFKHVDLISNSDRDVIAKHNVSVHPNPTSDKIKVMSDMPALTKLYNTEGILVMETNDSEINLTKLSSGLYQVVLQIDGELANFKIVKE